ncbi:MAG: PucR family transcriptional regulator ligand-binding domain-containing protein, partial [Actinobacteria bacterium]|nr:PucR family transcriptional regulator ligand-binding domain-containing protein [Actinomycetota bacterium]
MDGVTVAQLLTAPSLLDTAVLAGLSGLDRTVRGVTVLELPDIVPWVKPNELLLSTVDALGPAGKNGSHGDSSAHSAADLLALIADLDARQVPALAVRLGSEQLPPPVLELADELGFPLLRLADRVVFEEVLAEVFGVLLA